MNRTELKKLIQESYREILNESRQSKIDSIEGYVGTGFKNMPWNLIPDNCLSAIENLVKKLRKNNIQ